MTTETKLSRLGEMTPEQKQEAIARAVGWYVIENEEGGSFSIRHPVKTTLYPWHVCELLAWLDADDYTGSLDAMAEAEKALTPEERLKYQEILFLHCLPDDRIASWYLVHATAEQKSNAFLIAKQLAEKDF